MKPMRRLPWGALAAALLLAPAPVSGQSPLERADVLARAGRADEARAVLAEWWDADRASASRQDLQRGIWLRALLTVDPREAGLDFQRLVVEFPGGIFSDQALQRLAQAAEAGGDLHGAADQYRVILRDYPGSPLRLEAQNWLSDNRERLAQTPRLETPPAAPPQEDVEPDDPDAGEPPSQDQAGQPATAELPAADSTVRMAGDTTAQMAADSTVAEPQEPDPDPELLPGKHDMPVTVPAADSGASADSIPVQDRPVSLDTLTETVSPPSVIPAVTPEMEPEGDYTVQLGAFAAEGNARLLADRARRAGLETRIVQVTNSPLYRVRVGRFESADPATRLYDRVVRLGFDAMVLPDAARERPAGQGGAL